MDAEWTKNRKAGFQPLPQAPNQVAPARQSHRAAGTHRHQRPRLEFNQRLQNFRAEQSLVFVTTHRLAAHRSDFAENRAGKV